MRQIRPRAWRAVPLALILPVVLGACGSAGSSGGRIEHPTGDALVFRIESSGGFVTPDFLFGMLPEFTLLGDGRVIVPGAQEAIFPGPALPSVQERQLTEAGIQALLRLVAASGQFAASAEWRGAQNVVADAADTTFTLHADGREVTVTVYALGMDSPDTGGQGISSAERAARSALSNLVTQLGLPEVQLASTAWADAWHPYAPDAIRLLVRNVDGEGPDPSGLPAQELAWPVAGDPASFGSATAVDPAQRCGVVSGADATTWWQALGGANQLTRWTAAGHAYAVTVRPLLPDEARACPGDA